MAPQEPLEKHESYRRAAEFLAADREALGAAYKILHALARWSVEHATDADPAPTA